MSKLDSISNGIIQKPVVSITEEDVSEVILTLRKQRMTWKLVKRPARLGDRITIAYILTCRNQMIEAHENPPRAVVLSSQSFHKNLPLQSLIGSRGGKRITTRVVLTEDYPDSKFAGQHAYFDILVVEVCKPVLPALGGQFALELGLNNGGAKTIQKEVRGIMQRRVDSMIKQFIRKQVINTLMSDYLIIVNEEEVQLALNKNSQLEANSNGRPGDESPEQNTANIRSTAKLSAIMREIIRTENIVVDTKRLKTSITALALRADAPETAFDEYYENFEDLSRVEAEILEDQLIEHVLGHLNVKPITTSYNDFTSAEKFSPSSNLSTRATIELRTDNKCNYCGPSKCCQYITQQITAPRSKHDFEHLLWQVSHEHIELFKDSDGWHLLINTKCSHLQPDGRCGIYENRPPVCRNYSVKYCEFDGAANEDWELYFIDHQSLLEYCKQRYKRWGS